MIVRLFVDARDAQVARVLDEDNRSATIPAAWLPPDAHEGSWLNVELQPTAAPTTETTDRRHALGADDDGGDIKL